MKKIMGVDYYTTKEVADKLGLNRRTILFLMNKRKINFFQLGDNTSPRYVKVSEVERILNLANHKKEEDFKKVEDYQQSINQ